MQSSKVVLDTNIWISYFLKNNNEQFLRSILDNDIKLYRCTALTTSATPNLSVITLPQFEKLLFNP